jgi:TrpR family trp operon transcriptional repressor
MKDGWRGFLDLCATIDNPEMLDHLFALFFTFEERETLSSRYRIVKALLEGQLTQREIAEQHHVSIAQITRGSNALKIIDTRLKKLLSQKLDLKK